MSEENVDALLRGIEAFNRRDFEGLAAVFAPAGEWHPATSPAEGGAPYVGPEGLQKWWDNVLATFADFHATVDQTQDINDVIVALGRLSGRFRSGVEFDTELGWVARFRDGLVVRGGSFFNHAEALEAAGLSDSQK